MLVYDTGSSMSFNTRLPPLTHCPDRPPSLSHLLEVLLLGLERRVEAEGEQHHQDLEEAEEERDAGDPAGLDLQHEGDLLGAAVGPLVALDGVAAGVGRRDVPLLVVAGAVAAAAAHVLLRVTRADTASEVPGAVRRVSDVCQTCQRCGRGEGHAVSETDTWYQGVRVGDTVKTVKSHGRTSDEGQTIVSYACTDAERNRHE